MARIIGDIPPRVSPPQFIPSIELNRSGRPGKEKEIDPVTLVTSAISLLSPYVAKGAEEFAKELGKEAAQKAKELYSYLKSKFSVGSEESGLLSLFEIKPDVYESNLTSVLAERARTDADFARELAHHVESAGPYIKLVQTVRDGKKAVGANIQTANSGTLDLTQNAQSVEEVTAANIGILGK